MKLFKKKNFSTFNFQLSTRKGFTLIELLIVIAVLGVLAAAVLVALNPLEQIARARDSTRKSTVSSLANAIQAYFISKGSYSPGADWMNDLVSSGEIKAAPAEVVQTTQCVTNVVNNSWCYFNNNALPPNSPNVNVYTKLESKSQSNKCTTAGTQPYFNWDSFRGSTCLVCSSVEPIPVGEACNSVQ